MLKDNFSCFYILYTNEWGSRVARGEGRRARCAIRDIGLIAILRGT